jgi:putative transposase
MPSVVVALFRTVLLSCRSRAALHAEILALRHQLHVLERSRPQRIRLTPADRALWVALSRVWSGWRAASILVKPATVVAWHRRGFQLFWQWKSRRRVGRPGVSTELRTLIQTMSNANPLRGAPRIHGELLKLGIDVRQATVAKYIARKRLPPSPTWCAFLANHASQIIGRRLFVVSTVTYRLLFVLACLLGDAGLCTSP